MVLSDLLEALNSSIDPTSKSHILRAYYAWLFNEAMRGHYPLPVRPETAMLREYYETQVYFWEKYTGLYREQCRNLGLPVVPWY